MPTLVSSFRRRAWSLALLVLVVASAIAFSVACSSGGSTDDPDAGDGAEGTAGGDGATAVADDGMLPLGAAWEATVIGRFEGQGDVRAMKTVGGSLWVIGQQFNVPMLWRSDDGATWTEVSLVSPGTDRLSMSDIIERPEGGFVGYGQRDTECNEYEAPGGYRLLDWCQRSRPVIYLSEDGADWRVVDPPALAPPDGTSSVFLEGLVAHGGELVAAATI